MTGIDGSQDDPHPIDTDATVSEIESKIAHTHSHVRRILAGLTDAGESDRSGIGAALVRGLRSRSDAVDGMFTDATKAVDAARHALRAEIDAHGAELDED